MDDLETQLSEARDGGARHVMIATDGVFSMDGIVAKLPAICALADDTTRVVMVDDCHATGFWARRGAARRRRAGDRGSTSSPAPSARRWAARWAASSPRRSRSIDLLRQRARPYLFSNALPPAGHRRRAQGHRDRARGRRRGAPRSLDERAPFRAGMEAAGFELLPGEHPDHSGDAGRREAGAGDGARRSTSAASMSPASSSRSCRRARRASARRCRRR